MYLVPRDFRAEHYWECLQKDPLVSEKKRFSSAETAVAGGLSVSVMRGDRT
jgi:hypothetical protein